MSENEITHGKLLAHAESVVDHLKELFSRMLNLNIQLEKNETILKEIRFVLKDCVVNSNKLVEQMIKQDEKMAISRQKLSIFAEIAKDRGAQITLILIVLIVASMVNENIGTRLTEIIEYFIKEKSVN